MWAAVLLLALVPTTLAVAITSAIALEPDTAAMTERGRATSAATSDLMSRELAIESRLVTMAADNSMPRLADGIVGSERATATRAMTMLQGRDGSVVSDACITRIRDARTSALVRTATPAGANASCAVGTLLSQAAAAGPGGVVRSLPTGTDDLLLATPIGNARDPFAVLTLRVDLASLLTTTHDAAFGAPVAMLVDTAKPRLVSGTTQPASDDPAVPPPPAPERLAVYLNGLLTDHADTAASLERAGWTTTISELWPTREASRLGLVLFWPEPEVALTGPLLAALVLAVFVALVAVVVFMRLVLGPFRDLENSQEELEDAYHEARKDSLRDGLTGTGNHRAFQQELTRQVGISERDSVPFSLLLLDLDNLKIVNDRDGHAEGDKLLLGVTEAMRTCLRPSDNLYRIGGDEFAVVMPDTEPEQAAEAAERLRRYCHRPPRGDRPMPFSGGISAVPRHADEPGAVQRQADAALYWAKRHGRGFVEVFDPTRDKLADAAGPEGLGAAVYEVASTSALTPVFQPIVDLRTGAVLGFEGLVRPLAGGVFSDSERLFSAAAATGRTVELDLASLETIAAGAKELGGDHILSINLSAKTLEVKDFDAGWLLKTLVHYGISPSRVIVELTERDPVTDLARLRNNVAHLSEYGLRLAADDVGAGSAGLRLLAEVPFDVVKIDLSLVQGGSQHAASWAVLRSIRDLAWRQEAVIIGEGVETPEQLRALRQLAIPIGQGYLLGVPDATPDMRPRDLASLAAADVIQTAPVQPPQAAPTETGVPVLPRAPELPAQPASPPPISLAPSGLPAQP